VRAICGEYTSLYGNRVTVHTPKTPGTIPYFADFEDSLDVFGWTLNEGTAQTNEWHIGTATNNVAEYRALLCSLELAREMGADHLTVHSDSELLVKQMNGLYRVKNEQLLSLYLQARALCAGFSSVEIAHVPRSRNRRADQLANLALDTPDPKA
ncbi:MAG TPA: ribonuclease HI family protein, partial [bacterium]|nr:ribonuclease HI family protein [bacterium]